MPTPAERTALLFLAGVTFVGAGVRGARALQRGEKPPPAAARALQQQRAAVDSARVIRKARPPAPTRPVRIVKPKPVPVRFPVDVDRADSATLTALPGVGPSLALRIMADRDSLGPFGSLAEFDRRVRGVGPVMVTRIAALVTFSGRSPLPSP